MCQNRGFSTLRGSQNRLLFVCCRPCALFFKYPSASSLRPNACWCRWVQKAMKRWARPVPPPPERKQTTNKSPHKKKPFPATASFLCGPGLCLLLVRLCAHRAAVAPHNAGRRIVIFFFRLAKLKPDTAVCPTGPTGSPDSEHKIRFYWLKTEAIQHENRFSWPKTNAKYRPFIGGPPLHLLHLTPARTSTCLFPVCPAHSMRQATLWCRCFHSVGSQVNFHEVNTCSLLIQDS